MQFLFGVVEPASVASPLFDRLAVATAESNPAARPAFAAGSRLRLGYQARSFAMWQSGDVKLFLDGEILYIDGVPTTERGRSERELEQLAQLYRRYGEGLWQRLDGNFCLLIEEGRSLRIGVDLSGSRTLYYWVHDGTLAFHTHLLDLAPLFPGCLSEDWGSIGHFLNCGANIPGRTALEHIGHLSAGNHLHFFNGQVTIREHFRFEVVPSDALPPVERLTEQLADLMSEAIGVAWRAADRPVLPLSGGADSRYIVAELARQVDDRSLLRTITWGMYRDRPGSDVEAAAQVAAILGVEHVWHEKTQDHLETEFARSMHLSSGEGDAAIHYPDDPMLHESLARDFNFGSMFRGETVFRRFRPLLTTWGVLAENDVVRLYDNSGCRALLGDDVFVPMLKANRAAITELQAGLRSATPTGKRDELYFSFRVRQILSPHTKVKNNHLEVYSPLITRKVLDWIRHIPDQVRHKRVLFLDTLRRQYPELAGVPFAATSNLPAWRRRFQSEPMLSQFYMQWCAKPGWLASIDAQERVVAAWQSLAMSARPNHIVPGAASAPGWKDKFKDTLPGQLLREATLERRLSTKLPRYLMLARLAVLHGMLGRIAERRAAAPRMAGVTGDHVPVDSSSSSMRVTQLAQR